MAMIYVCDALDTFESASAALQLSELVPDFAEDAVAFFKEVLALASEETMPALRRKALLGLAQAYERRRQGHKRENRAHARVYRQQAQA